MSKKNNRKVIYEGKAKILYQSSEPNRIIQYFKDDATAFNNQKKDVIAGKGKLNCAISAHIMSAMNEIGLATHYVRTINEREQLVKQVEIIPVEVIIRNIAAGSIVKRLGIKEGERFDRPIIEFCAKSDELGDPLINDDHIFNAGWCSPEELDFLRLMSIRINDFLQGLFVAIGINMVDLKLEFGRYFQGSDEYPEESVFHIILADEISPDNCRLWDIKTGEKMDKDRFRNDIGGLVDAYSEIAKRLGIALNNISGINNGSDNIAVLDNHRDNK